jgi:hypothetical protein
MTFTVPAGDVTTGAAVWDYVRLELNDGSKAYPTPPDNNALGPCRQSVQADPTRANAWFLLGSILFGNSPLDAKSNPIFSPEVKQALDKYLELAPDGPHASDVKAMLSMIPK